MLPRSLETGRGGRHICGAFADAGRAETEFVDPDESWKHCVARVAPLCKTAEDFREARRAARKSALAGRVHLPAGGESSGVDS